MCNTSFGLECPSLACLSTASGISMVSNRPLVFGFSITSGCVRGGVFGECSRPCLFVRSTLCGRVLFPLRRWHDYPGWWYSQYSVSEVSSSATISDERSCLMRYFLCLEISRASEVSFSLRMITSLTPSIKLFYRIVDTYLEPNVELRPIDSELLYDPTHYRLMLLVCWVRSLMLLDLIIMTPYFEC